MSYVLRLRCRARRTPPGGNIVVVIVQWHAELEPAKGRDMCVRVGRDGSWQMRGA